MAFVVTLLILMNKCFLCKDCIRHIFNPSGVEGAPTLAVTSNISFVPLPA